MPYFIVWTGVTYKPDQRRAHLIPYVACVDAIVGGKHESVTYVHSKAVYRAGMMVLWPVKLGIARQKRVPLPVSLHSLIP